MGRVRVKALPESIVGRMHYQPGTKARTTVEILRLMDKKWNYAYENVAIKIRAVFGELSKMHSTNWGRAALTLVVIGIENVAMQSF